MRVFVTGGTGLIGGRLVRRLVDRGDHPVVLSRRADQARLRPSSAGSEIIQGDPSVPGGWEAAIEGCDAVVNLVGHNLFAQRWDREVKRTLRDSRVHATENVVAALRGAAVRPRVLVQASAIGYYGPCGDEVLTETSASGNDFMAAICRDWEAAAQPAAALGVRLATVRTGVVLARGAGMLGALEPVYKWIPFGAAPVGSGGRLRPGRGQQWLSWIHLDDIAGIFLLALDNEQAAGPINGTSPQPVRHADFSRAMSRAVRRLFVPMGPPDFVLKTLLGEVAEVVTTGQRVLPAVAERLGYSFQFPALDRALAELFGRHPAASAG
jgi:uncharacterized protein (TIGR01777 family)